MTSCMFIMHEPDFETPSKHGRYEYRIWPRSIPASVPMLHRDWVLENAQSRADIYLLNGNSSHTLVKLRDGKRLEIKRRGKDLRGLQHWRVALSQDFPLSRLALDDLTTALRLPNRPSQAARLSPAHCLAELSDSSSSLETRTLQKSRLIFRRGTCRAEITRVTWNGLPRLTIALEDPEPDRAAQGVRALGLDRWPNRSYGDVLHACPRLIVQPAQYNYV